MLLGKTKNIGRIPWPQLVLEAFLVVLSVLLALALKSWYDSRSHEALAEQALYTIQREIEANRTEVEEALSYHRVLLDSLAANPDQGVALRPAFIRNIAWETAQATGAVAYLEYPVTSIVAEISEMQERYQQLVHITVQILYTTNVMPQAREEERQRSGYYPIIRDLSGIEKRLLERYEQALERIKT